MNFFKYSAVLFYLFFASFSVNAQQENKDVTIKASGSGKTVEEAKQTALRSAIEQAFGAFISSKTEMLNDQVVADQMASVSSGNIKSFEVLNQDQLPDGRWGITLNAVVSIDKLTSFVAAKGVVIEIKGGMFALNIKQQLLNEQGEIKAIAEMVGMLHEPMQISFDYIIKSGDPKSLDAESKNWEIPLVVTATANKNIDFCANYFIKTLQALSLSAEEVAVYKSLNKAVFVVNIKYKNEARTFYLRKKGSINILKTLTRSWEFYTRLFTVKSGLDLSNGNGIAKLHEFAPEDNYRYSSDNGVDILFLTAGQQAATFSWSDKRTLAQIEQMTGYEVKPRGVVSQFKYGGFVVAENQDKSLVFGIADLEEMNWNNAKIACEELVLNGYSDWRLPTLDELKLGFLFKQNQRGECLGINYGDRNYIRHWSSDASVKNDNPKLSSNLRDYKIVIGLDDAYVASELSNNNGRVRPVRVFSKLPTPSVVEPIKSSVQERLNFSGNWNLEIKTDNGPLKFAIRFEYINGLWEGYYFNQRGKELKMNSVQNDGRSITFTFIRLTFKLTLKDDNENEAIGKIGSYNMIAKRSTTSN